MRIKTEMTERPPEYSVVNDGGTARIRFFEDVREFEREDGVAYTATMWEMSCPWMGTLPERIRKNPEIWRAKVRSVTAAEEAAAQLEELKVTATDDAICELAEIVADLADAVVELAGMIMEV